MRTNKKEIIKEIDEFVMDLVEVKFALKHGKDFIELKETLSILDDNIKVFMANVKKNISKKTLGEIDKEKYGGKRK